MMTEFREFHERLRSLIGSPEHREQDDASRRSPAGTGWLVAMRGAFRLPEEARP